MKEMPLISVILPVYRVEKYLDRCLQSITGQTYRNLEIILVDDGSPDSSGAMCDAWAEKDSRIRVIHKENAGAGAARNTGLDAAAGEIISMIDSDDYLQVHMFEHLLSLMTEDVDIAECDICWTELDDIPMDDGSKAETVVSIAREHPETNFVLAHCAGLFQNGNYPFFPNMDSLERICDAGLPENVWIDTAHYLLYAYQTVMAKMVRLAGAEHVVFGTDSPLQGAMQMKFAQDVIYALDIPQTEKDAIMYGNAMKILDLER